MWLEHNLVMTTNQIETRLQAVGATAAEAELLAEIMYLNGWFEKSAVKPSNQEKADMSTWLADFRAERSIIAENNAAAKRARIAAGYRAA
jgi:hypothetical protein